MCEPCRATRCTIGLSYVSSQPLRANKPFKGQSRTTPHYNALSVLSFVQQHPSPSCFRPRHRARGYPSMRTTSSPKCYNGNNPHFLCRTHLFVPVSQGACVVCEDKEVFVGCLFVSSTILFVTLPLKKQYHLRLASKFLHSRKQTRKADERSSRRSFFSRYRIYIHNSKSINHSTITKQIAPNPDQKPCNHQESKIALKLFQCVLDMTKQSRWWETV